MRIGFVACMATCVMRDTSHLVVEAFSIGVNLSNSRTKPRSFRFQTPTASDKHYFPKRQAVLSGQEDVDDRLFDIVVVGSGNGACAFLSHYLNQADEKAKVLVLEQGQNFFFTGDITHQNGWSKTYSTGDIFKLHSALTPSGKPIISGRAITMGGGGSINYTMMHESSKWLAKNLGRTEKFWDDLKTELNKKFQRPDPRTTETPFSEYLQGVANTKGGYELPNPVHFVSQGNIPSYEDTNDKQLFMFPTQFNFHGQRTNSGVSLVNWEDPRVQLEVRREVKALSLDESTGGEGTVTCEGVEVKNLLTGENESYKLREGGKVILCGGSSTPRLLMRHGTKLENDAIGQRVSDHICMPLAIYVVPEEYEKKVGPKDAYEPLFAMSMWKPDQNQKAQPTLCNFDFFSGSLDRLIYLVSSLYLAYLPFNRFKKWMGKNPFVFTLLSNGVRVLLSTLIFGANAVKFILDKLKGKEPCKITITTALLKFNPAQEGQYEGDGGKNEQITLGFFEDDQDRLVAEEAIKDNLDFLEATGHKPFFLFRWLFRFVTKIPYEKGQVGRYVKHFSDRTLLSEQHLAGGCLFGEAIDAGENDPSRTGQVYGSSNIHVADLSTVPLPRVSTQMTAYLVGHFVSKQLYPGRN